jgi:tRNA 2-(methylsulfanyl)-N6-isopentenyladenosine37 hydroxylase
MLDLRFATPSTWLDAVFRDFDAFLLDHAACERKASATGMSFVVRYPDKKPLIAPLIEFAREELEHFQIVYGLIEERGLTLVDDYKDPYVNALRAECRGAGEALLLDRLLIAGIVEARGCERLFLLADALTKRDARLSSVYLELARAESRHHGLFFRLARELFAEQRVQERGAVLLDFEAALVARLPHRPAVH